MGLDEAGRGPCIGPLVVAAVAIPSDDIPLLKEIGVADSKDLSEKKRMMIHDWFFEQAEVRDWKFSINPCPAERIDMSSGGIGLNLLEVELFAECINQIGQLDKVSIMADACDVNAERFASRIGAQVQEWPWQDSKLHSEHKADSNHLIVGMASILAKTARDKWMEDYSQQKGVNLGSGYPSDPNTKQALAGLLEQDLPDEHLRWSWATTKNAYVEIKGKPCPQRGETISVQKTLF